jgi:RTX calcium-binding nonapeptide repeat (4 copies)
MAKNKTLTIGADIYNDDNLDTFIFALAGNDVVHGNGGNDTIYGGLGNDTLYGDAGNDTLNGEVGNDTLYGGLGKNLLYGGDGNDVLYGNLGVNDFFGGIGINTVSYAGLAAGTGVLAGKGAKVDIGGSVAAAWGALGDNFFGINNVTGSSYDDWLDMHVYGVARGANGNDHLQLFAGGAAYGGNGDDGFGIINGGTAYGDDGIDSIFVVHGGNIYGGTGIDYLYAEGGVGHYDGGADEDYLIFSKRAPYTLPSTAFTVGQGFFPAGSVVGVNITINDILNTGTGAWAAQGDTYKSMEYIYGSEYADVIDFTPNLTVQPFYHGSGFGDTGDVFGAGGNDVIFIRGGHSTGANSGSAYANGGTGDDKISFTDVGYADGGDGADVIRLYNGGTANGNAGSDLLFAYKGGSSLNGGAGSDTIDVRGGTAYISNSGGLDTIKESLNNAVMHIVLNTGLFGGTEYVYGFDRGQDKFNLAYGLLGPTIDAADVVFGPFSNYNRASAQVHLVYSGADTLIYFDGDGTGTKNFEIKIATAIGVHLGVGDFSYF